MSLMHFDPFRDLDRATEQVMSAARMAVRAIPMEAYRRGDEFYVHLDVPGINPDDVDLTVERNVLSIRCQRRSPRQEGDEVIVDERPHGIFARQLFLSDGLDTSRLTASYDRGVLNILIPVAESSKPRRVPINSEAGSPQQIDLTGGNQAEQRMPAGSQSAGT
ncbi:MAG: heat shock protein Hsp20 [Frankiales bacterium]|jgi:HSP20 family protein|nr:heat shock protein Hsp20 [Frankiales bacterium]